MLSSSRVVAVGVLALSVLTPPLSASADVDVCTEASDKPTGFAGQYCACTETLVVKLLADDQQIITCNLDVGTPSSAEDGQLYAVTAYTTDHDYSIFGRDEEGTNFCCVVDHEFGYNDVYFVFQGSSEADTIEQDSGYGLLDTVQATAEGKVIMSVETHGNGGDDYLSGNDGAYGVNDQHFWGNAGDDDIRLGGQFAKAWGGLGDDVIYARDSGKPIVYGDTSTSSIVGGADKIVGNTSDGLEAHGGPGNDTICGTDFDDDLYGGDGDDFIWSYDETGDDFIDGDDDTDACGGDGPPTVSNCESTPTGPRDNGDCPYFP